MSEKSTKFDLSGAQDPKEFVQKLIQKYPDENVHLALAGKYLLVHFNDSVPTNIRIDVLSFLSDKVKEAIHGQQII